ncbi:MAG TPA: 50S ribosomal protein L10 [Phycisphaerales bacterium]|jgi:large subunit ribosomal protein L10|nr:50S ribosomal protein L10 [Phycisphaerales bacterium]
MSKPIKELIINAYKGKFEDVSGALVLDIRGLTSNDNNTLRNGLLKKKIRVTVVKNSLAKKAFSGTALEPIGPALEGPSALAYGESVVDVAREIIDWAKKIKTLSFKGAVLDGQYFAGAAGVKRLSEFPTREEAQAKVVTLVLSPARKVVGCVVSPGSKILGIVKEIQTRMEKGETIAKGS